ncbi:CheR family methyltransferase [Dichotomicrobium thermohalophilum]|uniref:Blue-light-activated histidine kinase n=1 Tax=Dichotomicrobium thermohalophilum TaxID=933063 RepID=A0A397PK32_9HYPH|nr:CheR family methyltransferase [Dichotomicrobium thermohalophilum]RIA47625.1 two-component system CheB/CheR fusion protein [Dichotomicrobium thermohalophilum]
MDNDNGLKGLEAGVIPVCAIGASAGGLAPLQDLFNNLAPDLGLAYVVVVHLAPEQPSELASILGGFTTMPVQQVKGSTKLEPNRVYVIPPDRALSIDGNELSPAPFKEPHGKRAPIDMLLNSIASGRGDGMAVILSGTGSDGALGVRAIKEAGGIILVQDPEEAEYGMMPRGAITTGGADFIGPASRIAERIGELARGETELKRQATENADEVVPRILGLLHNRTGHDFSGYKRNTMLRRMARRLQVTRCSSLNEYLVYLRETPAETQALLQDLLISVTHFFRDPEAFDALAEQAITPLFDNVGEEGIRVWVVGCATGEEAYSIAILLLEEAERRRIRVPIQIFATDLDEAALETAREGRYPATIEANVSEGRLRRFFDKDGSVYSVKSEVRELIIFAVHDVLKDPPFMRLHLISCRNLLIYLERQMQRLACSIFHYALMPQGCLFLGSAESIDSVPELFTPVRQKERIYRPRIGTAVALPQLQRSADHLSYRYGLHEEPGLAFRGRAERDQRIGKMHLAALEEEAPPSVLVDEMRNVQHLSPRAGYFMGPPGGPFSADLSTLVRPELRMDVAMALRRALEHGESMLTAPVAVGFNGTKRRVAIHAVPVREETDTHAGPPQALVFFLDGGPIEEMPAESPTETADEEKIRRLREDLRAAEERLAASQKEQEDTIQELRIANEELQSTNEEYRSASEELETSKEELQSMNEELQTVNSELKSKLESISQAHSDLRNLAAATEIGTLFLDPQLRIRMTTPPVAGLFNVTEADAGRLLSDFTHQLRYKGLIRDAEQVLSDLTSVEREVQSDDGRWFAARLRPYRTVDNRIDGVVVTFVDITERRKALEIMRKSEERFRALTEASSDVIYQMSPDWSEMRQLSGGGFLADTPGPITNWLDKYIPAEDQPEVMAAIRDAIRTKSVFELEHRVRRSDGTVGWTFSRAVPIVRDGEISEWFGAASDETDRKMLEEQQQLLIRELNHRVRNMLAVVQSLAEQTWRTAETEEDFLERFRQRLRAYSETHSLLTRSNWEGASLEDLVREVGSTFCEEGTTVGIDGPTVMLTPDAATTLAMALHELGTNALKYGAWSQPGGHVNITWRFESEPAGGDRLHLEWGEQGGPSVSPPERRGFGSEVLKGALAYEFGGTVNLDYRPEGLLCTMDLPLDHKLFRG